MSISSAAKAGFYSQSHAKKLETIPDFMDSLILAFCDIWMVIFVIWELKVTFNLSC